jgi:hypothetical protein
MNDRNDEFNSPEDAVVREKLAEIYAAPSDPVYWSNLQVRVLSRIADSDAGLWWVFLGRWSRAGIVAAALALMAAGVASAVTRQSDDMFVYQPLMDEGLPASTVQLGTGPITTLERVSSMVGVSEDEAAVRYVLSLVDGSGR